MAYVFGVLAPTFMYDFRDIRLGYGIKLAGDLAFPLSQVASEEGSGG